MSGCTTAADHHYLYPAGLENAVDIEVEEALGLGMRMTVSRGSMNLSVKDGGLPPDSVVQDEDDDPRRQRAGAEAVPRSEAGREDPGRARALFAVLDLEDADERKRAPRRALRLPASHPPLRDGRRGAVLPRNLWPAAGRSSGGDGLDVEPRLAGARHSFQRGGDRAARPGGRRRLPLRRLEHGAGVGHLPDLRARGGGLAGRPRRRRLGLERFIEHDGGGAACADDRAPALRRGQGHPSRRFALGDRRLGALSRALRHRQDRSGSGGGPRALHPGRSALLRRARSRSPRSCSAARIGPTG